MLLNTPHSVLRQDCWAVAGLTLAGAGMASAALLARAPSQADHNVVVLSALGGAVIVAGLAGSRRAAWLWSPLLPMLALWTGGWLVLPAWLLAALCLPLAWVHG